MSSISFPSKPSLVADTPEVQKFSGAFVYNFFTQDERINDQGTIPESIIKKGSKSFDKGTTNTLSKVPRFIRLTWNQVKIIEPEFNLSPLVNVGSSGLSVENQNFIKKHYSKILREESFGNYGFSGIEFQDTAIDGKLHLLVSGTVAKFTNSRNVNLANTVNDQLEFISQKIDTNNVSLLDVSKFLSKDLSNQNLSNQLIVDALTNLKSAGARFYTEDQQKELIEKKFEALKNVKTRSRINNKFIKTFLTSIANDSLGFFADEVGPLLLDANEIQTEMVQNTNPDSIEEAEYDISVEPILLRSTPKDSTFLPTRKHIGYIIDKYQKSSNGSITELEPIIIENSETASVLDSRIAYGISYIYQIRAIYLLEFQSFSDDDDQMAISTILISSAPSQRVIVNAEEVVPPPPPADINIFWDFVEQAPCITWSFPVNPQRDIKRWQVFRRKTIDEAFELLVEIDFDDSAVITQNFEKVNINLKMRLTGPQNFWIDKDFKKDDKFIYTVGSVDAHGMSSNYGMQFETKFNRYNNNIEKKLISGSGAPKPYPNMFLNTDTFVDVMKDSNHKKMKIYFDPEYLEIVKNGSKSESVAKISNNGASYKMQMINVDFQQSQILDIFIDDFRTIKKDSDSPGGIGDSKILGYKVYIENDSNDIVKG
jgi:hypothetical protein